MVKQHYSNFTIITAIFSLSKCLVVLRYFFSVSADHYTADATHIGPEYLKARFIEYTDGNFTTAKTPTAAEAHRHILGPLIRAQVGDWITVVLQNDCPFNVSIYLQGVSLDKAQDGLWEKRTGSKLSQ